MDSGEADAAADGSKEDAQSSLDGEPNDANPTTPPNCLGSGATQDSLLPAQSTCNRDPGILLGVPIVDPQALNNPHHIRFPNTRCMTGSGLTQNSGITVHLKPGAPGVIVFLQGGGLCIDAVTCAGVRNPDGLSLDPIALLADWVLEGGPFFGWTIRNSMFVRDNDLSNPFRDWHQVFIHYCSGDVHAGNITTPVNAPGTPIDGRLFQGRANMEMFLGRLVPTFGAGGPHEVQQVVLAGSSAGGMGALLNYERTQRAFGCTPVHLLVDSAPPLAADALLNACMQAGWQSVLALDASNPNCTGCDFAGGNASRLLPSLAQKYPGRRFAWFTETRDCVLRALLAVPPAGCSPPPTDGAAFKAGLESFRESMSAFPNFRTFFYAGDWHTLSLPPAGFGDAIKGSDAVSGRTLSQVSAQSLTFARWVSDALDPTVSWTSICDEQPTRDEHVGCQ